MSITWNGSRADEIVDEVKSAVGLEAQRFDDTPGMLVYQDAIQGHIYVECTIPEDALAEVVQVYWLFENDPYESRMRIALFENQIETEAVSSFLQAMGVW